MFRIKRALKVRDTIIIRAQTPTPCTSQKNEEKMYNFDDAKDRLYIFQVFSDPQRIGRGRT